MHGVLRIIVELNNENVSKINIEIGYLHRGTEKLSEYSEYYKILPFFDRLDYTGLILCEHSYILSVEKLIDYNINLKIQIQRTILNELMRVSSHFLALTTSAMDIGAVTPFLWLFEEREEIFTIFENISGARMHTALFKIGGINHKVTYTDLLNIQELVIRLKVKIIELYELLNNSNIWRLRLQNTGVITRITCYNFALSGPVLRSAGILLDQRLNQPYETFNFIPIPIIYGQSGDNFTRFFLRLEEIIISLQYIDYLLQYCLINNSVKLLSNNKLTSKNLVDNKNVIIYTKNKDSMESIIYKFKNYSEGVHVYSNKTHLTIESPKGEFGLSLISNNKIPNRPYRLKIRSPGFYNLSSLNIVCTNYIISDLLAYLSTLDLILGEIDK